MREQVLLVRHDWDGYLLRCVWSPGPTEELTDVDDLREAFWSHVTAASGQDKQKRRTDSKE